MDLGGQSVLSRVVQRLGRARLLQQIVVATSAAAADDALALECARLRVPCFRGSEEDVLDRYYQTAGAWPSDAVVRGPGPSGLIVAVKHVLFAASKTRNSQARALQREGIVSGGGASSNHDLLQQSRAAEPLHNSAQNALTTK